MNRFFDKIFTLLLTFTLISVSVPILAQQEDENCQDDATELINYSILSPVQSSITSAKGWARQDNGKWVSSQNRIPFTDEKTSKSNNPRRKLGQDNFIAIELRKIMIKDRQYNVLIKKYHDGEFEFPILKEDWKDFNSLDYYVFESKLLEQILPHEVPFNQKYAVNLNTFARGTIRNYDPDREEDLIVRDVQAVIDGYKVNDWNLVFAVYPVKNGDTEVVRFKLIKTFRKDYLVSHFVAPDNWEMLFDKSFYEVPFHIFKSFIRNSEEYYIPEAEIADSIIDPYLSYYNQGVLKYQMGDYESAIQFFLKALQIDPETDDFLIYSFLGNARSKMRFYNDAIGDYDKALDLKPKNMMDYSDWVRNYFNRGVAKYYLQDIAGACKDWEKALELGFGPAHDYITKYCDGDNTDNEQKFND
jgi:tetratricopeptide (TPR) repeat protein